MVWIGMRSLSEDLDAQAVYAWILGLVAGLFAYVAQGPTLQTLWMLFAMTTFGMAQLSTTYAASGWLARWTRTRSMVWIGMRSLREDLDAQVVYAWILGLVAAWLGAEVCFRLKPVFMRLWLRVIGLFVHPPPKREKEE